MTYEKYKNALQYGSLDHIRGLIRDLDDPGNGLSRDEKRIRRAALEAIRNEKLKNQPITHHA